MSPTVITSPPLGAVTLTQRTGVGVAVRVDVLVEVAVAVSVSVGAGVKVSVGVTLGVSVSVGVTVDVLVGVAVIVDVNVCVEVDVLVAVGVEVNVPVFIRVRVIVGGFACAVLEETSANTSCTENAFNASNKRIAIKSIKNALCDCKNIFLFIFDSLLIGEWKIDRNPLRPKNATGWIGDR
jgi:hypothetical protein